MSPSARVTSERPTGENTIGGRKEEEERGEQGEGAERADDGDGAGVGMCVSSGVMVSSARSPNESTKRGEGEGENIEEI